MATPFQNLDDAASILSTPGPMPISERFSSMEQRIKQLEAEVDAIKRRLADFEKQTKQIPVATASVG